MSQQILPSDAHRESPPSYALEIERRDQLEALAVPARQEVLDSIHALQPCSVREVASHLGRKKTALYHHVHALLQVGLLEEEGLRSTGRRPEMLYRVPHNMRLRYEPSDPANVELMGKIAQGITRMAMQDFSDGFDPDLAVVEGPQRNLWASRIKLWLSDEDLEEVNKLLYRILRPSAQQRGVERRLYSISWVLAPCRTPDEAA